MSRYTEEGFQCLILALIGLIFLILTCALLVSGLTQQCLGVVVGDSLARATLIPQDPPGGVVIGCRWVLDLRAALP